MNVEHIQDSFVPNRLYPDVSAVIHEPDTYSGLLMIRVSLRRPRASEIGWCFTTPPIVTSCAV